MQNLLKSKKAQLGIIEAKYLLFGVIIGIILGFVLMYMGKVGIIPFKLNFFC